MLSDHNTKIDEQRSYNTYREYLECALKQQSLRMGYPLTGPICGFFTPQNWQSSDSAGRLVDQQSLGIMNESLSDTLLLNIGDPESSRADEIERKARGLYYPEDVENEVIGILSRYFKAENNQLKGYVTCGGTEANLACIWWLRNYLLNVATISSSSDLVLYTSNQAHYSCTKICQILNIKMIKIESTQNGQMSVNHLAETIKVHMQKHPWRPMIIWLTFGTTILGAVDNLLEVNALIKKEVIGKKGQCVTHLDGAILGVTLPLLYPEYSPLFELVDSLAISGHKLLATSLACGVVLAKRSIVQQAFLDRDITVGYVHGIKDITITGGRSALPIFQLHMSLKKLGFETDANNFKKLIDVSLQNASYLAAELGKLIGHHRVMHNNKQFNVVFPLLMSDKNAEYLKEKYTLMPLPHQNVCVTVFPNVHKALIEAFLNEYKSRCNAQEVLGIRAKL